VKSQKQPPIDLRDPLNFLIKLSLLKVGTLCTIRSNLRNPTFSRFVIVHSRYRRQTTCLDNSRTFQKQLQRSAKTSVMSKCLIPPSHSYRLSPQWYKVLMTSQAHSSVKSQFLKRAKPLPVVVKFRKHLSHSRQWFNIHIIMGCCTLLRTAKKGCTTLICFLFYDQTRKRCFNRLQIAWRRQPCASIDNPSTPLQHLLRPDSTGRLLFILTPL